MDIIEEIKGILDTDLLSGFRATQEGHDGGPYVQRFERAIADKFHVKYALCFNSATAALHAACVACGVGGGTGICSPYTFTASASCVLHTAGFVYFGDIDKNTYCLSPDLEMKVYPWYVIKAIIPVHLCGNMANMDEFMHIRDKYGVKIIEDACQAIGSKYHGKYAGTIGDCGVYSFNQSKQISTGEGGCLVTNNDEIEFRARLVRNHGEVVFPMELILGWNYRMTEVEAIIGYHRFQKLDEIIGHRRAMADIITSAIGPTGLLLPPFVPAGVEHSYYTYAMKIRGLDGHKLCKDMTDRGFPLRVGYVKPLNLHPIYGNGNQPCPVAERMWQSELIVTDIVKEPKETVERFCSELEGVLKNV